MQENSKDEIIELSEHIIFISQWKFGHEGVVGKKNVDKFERERSYSSRWAKTENGQILLKS